MSRPFTALAIGVAVALVSLSWLWQTPRPLFDTDKIEDFHYQHHLRNGSIRSWEEGVYTEALLELHHPELTVFGRTPFPGGHMPSVPSNAIDNVPGLASAARYIRVNETLLCEGEGSAAPRDRYCQLINTCRISC
jgi:hypothetical protein